MHQESPESDAELRPVEDVIDGWREEGYTADFEVAAGGSIECGRDETHEPESVQVDHQFRYEGATNPGDEEILLAVTAPCGAKGTLTLAYGPSASADEAEASRRLGPPGDR